MKRNRSGSFLAEKILSQPPFSLLVLLFIGGSVAGCFAAAGEWAQQAQAFWQLFWRWSANGFVSLFVLLCLLAMGDCAVLWLLGRAAAGLVLAPAAVFARGFLITFLGASRIWEDGWSGVMTALCGQGAAQLLSLPLLLVLATLCCSAKGKRGAFARLYQKCGKAVRALVFLGVVGCAAQSALVMFYLPALW